MLKDASVGVADLLRSVRGAKDLLEGVDALMASELDPRIRDITSEYEDTHGLWGDLCRLEDDISRRLHSLRRAARLMRKGAVEGDNSSEYPSDFLSQIAAQELRRRQMADDFSEELRRQKLANDLNEAEDPDDGAS